MRLKSLQRKSLEKRGNGVMKYSIILDNDERYGKRQTWKGKMMEV